jgi:hypothetical protein
VTTSTDGGLTWGAPVPVIIDRDFKFFNDKNAMAVDDWGSSPHRGNVYLAWDRLIEDPLGQPFVGTFTGPAMFSRSTDGGASFSTPQVVFATGTNKQTIGNVPVVFPNGDVAVLGTYFRPHGGELSLLGVEAGHRVEVDAIDREVEGYDHQATAQGLRRLAGRVPAFAGAPFARGHRGVYDTSADSRAVLDAAPGVAGLFVAGGFSGTGFKKSPAVGACMAELVTEGRATTVDLHPFRLGRFAEGDPIVGDEYALPPGFGHRL